MSGEQVNNPLHGIKLATMLEQLFREYGWEELGDTLNINAFKNNPTYKSSLKFLRTTPWAREKVENFYLKNMIVFNFFNLRVVIIGIICVLACKQICLG